MKAGAFTRQRDEAILSALNCWDEGWSTGDIFATFPDAFPSRSAVIGMIARVHEADPDALARKPKRTNTVRSKRK